MQVWDGCTRVKVPVMKWKLRSGIKQVKSREASVTEAPEALSYDTGTMQRWLPHVDGADIADSILLCTVYLTGPEDLSATVDVVIECEFVTSDVSERAVRAAEAMILRLASSPMIGQLDKLNPPDMLPISLADVGRLVAAGRLGPFSAKSNGIHMLAWPDGSGLLFMRMATPGTHGR